MYTYDCAPTLTDRQVLDFCQKGFLMLDNVVPEDVNRRTIDYLNQNPRGEPTGILNEDWFMDQVMCNPQAAGAVRSLLGANFHLPVLMSNHRGQCPYTYPGGWHVDGNYIFDHTLNYLQVFYYPQAAPLETGPTELVPGSHFWRNQQRFMSHYGHIRGSYISTAGAGSIFITVYQVWHRRAIATAASGTRNLLKYFYWRTTPPQRDWVVEPDFDLEKVDYEAHGFPVYGEQFQGAKDTARLFYWLSGKAAEYQCLGGQSWPLPADRLAPGYGFPGREKLVPRPAPAAY